MSGRQRRREGGILQGQLQRFLARQQRGGLQWFGGEFLKIICFSAIWAAVRISGNFLEERETGQTQ